MKIKYKILITIAIVLLVFIFLGFYYVSWKTSLMLARDYERISKEMLLKWQVQSNGLITRYYKLLKIYEDIAIREAAHFVEDEDVLKAYEIANSGDLTDIYDQKTKEARRIIKAKIGSMSEIIKRNSGQENYKLHFHTKNTRSLARVWRKDWQKIIDGRQEDVTDDLSSYRYIINRVSETKQCTAGIEVGRDGLDIRGVCPILDKYRNFIGSVEFIVPFSEVLQGLVHGKRVNFAIYMQKRLLAITESFRNSQLYPIIDNKFVQVATTDDILFRNFFLSEMIGKLSAGEYEIVADNYLCSIPIKDYSGSSIGILVFAINIEDDLNINRVMRGNALQEADDFRVTLALGCAGVFFIVMLILYLFIARIISTLENTANELIISEQKYRSLFNHMIDGFTLNEIILDENNKPVDYKFLLVNPAYEKQVGLKREDIVGKRILEVMPEAEQLLIEKYGEVALTQRPVQFEKYSKKLQKYFNIYSFSPREGLFAVVYEDITIRKNSELEKEKIQEELLNSEKMRVVGQLAGGIAHDFNNLLGGIIGCAEILELRLKEKDLSVFVKRIMEAGERASDLSKKLLTFANKDFAPCKSIDVRVLLKDCCQLLTKKISADIRLVEDYNAVDLTVWGDRSQLLNLFINLGMNSAQAMTEGCITFEIRNMDIVEEYVELSSFDISPGKYVRIKCIDEGDGIAEENLDKIFEPFFTTREIGGGNGLGLAAVLGTVKAHKGEIKVFSELHKGTTVVVLLPCKAKFDD